MLSKLCFKQVTVFKNKNFQTSKILKNYCMLILKKNSKAIEKLMQSSFFSKIQNFVSNKSRFAKIKNSRISKTLKKYSIVTFKIAKYVFF